ncbi:hypothetical protein BKA80DRAFT_311215 [Phyllosticta citrichinensis]
MDDLYRPTYEEEPLTLSPRERRRAECDTVYREREREVLRKGSERKLVLTGQADGSQDSEMEKKKTNHLLALTPLLEHEVSDTARGYLARNCLRGTEEYRDVHLKHKGIAAMWTNLLPEFVRDSVVDIFILARGTEHDLLKIGYEAQRRVWKVHFLKDSLGFTKRMWLRIASTIDFDVIFNPPETADESTKTILKGWYDHFLQC